MKQFLHSKLPLLAALCLTSPAWAQQQLQTINVEQSMTVDPVGDGTMTLKIVMTGKQFENWQGKYGTNQSLLKRDLSRYVSQYETTDWKVDTQQMDRTVIITCKFQGAVIHEGNGVFQFRVPKAWKGGERHDNIIDYNYIEPAGQGAVTQNQIKLELPSNASNFAEDKSEVGDRIVRYTLSQGGGLSNLLLLVGVISLLGGAGLVGYATLVK